MFQYCHCSRCRKFAGSAHAANLLVSPEQFTWLAGEEFVGRFEPAHTKHFATSFCKHCGYSLPWLGKTGRAVVVTAGILDADPEMRPLSAPMIIVPRSATKFVPQPRHPVIV